MMKNKYSYYFLKLFMKKKKPWINFTSYYVIWSKVINFLKLYLYFIFLCRVVFFYNIVTSGKLIYYFWDSRIFLINLNKNYIYIDNYFHLCLCMFTFYSFQLFFINIHTNNTLFINIKINRKILKNKDYYCPVRLLKYTVNTSLHLVHTSWQSGNRPLATRSKKDLHILRKRRLRIAIYMYICMCTYIHMQV